MNNETIQPKEILSPEPMDSGSFSRASLDNQQIQTVMALRKQSLERLKSNISLKLYYATEEKLQKEEKRLQEILDWQEGKISKLSQYSLILNPHYFDQEFLG